MEATALRVEAVKPVWTYKVPFVKGDFTQWLDIEVSSETVADFVFEIRKARQVLKLSSAWVIDLDGVVPGDDNPAPF